MLAVRMAKESSWRGVTRYQWVVLGVAWLGWVFDAMDATIYALVLHPALKDLLAMRSGSVPTQDEIVRYGGIIFAVFLVGWAVGGIVFGIVADRFGRTRALTVTILIYALFTGLAGLSQTWWQLALYRFLTALGIGGEWAAGAALVAEVWPEEKRARAAGWLQSAWAAGFLAAAGVTLAMRGQGWRWTFVVGVAPALVAVLVRLKLREPERWVRASKSGESKVSRLRELFSPSLLRGTLVGSGLAFVAVFGLWGATNWTPTLVRALPEMRSLDAETITIRVSVATMLLNAGALAGYLMFGPIAERFGRRPAFGFMCGGSLVMLPVAFLLPRTYSEVLWLLPVLGFFNNGIFSGFPIYLPELFPTALRATGAGFCFNAGRFLAALGPFATGSLVSVLGGFERAASSVAVIYLAGLVILVWAPETRGRELPT